VKTTSDPARATGQTLACDLSAPSSGLEAAIELRQASGRWVAISAARGQRVTAIGASARGAITASLAWLGPAAVSELLADLRLIEASRQLRTLSAG
jgi:hypothetical protein